MHFSIKASLLNFWERRIHPAEITVENGRIASVKEIHPDEILTNGVIMPGFIDAHVHIESSMLIPSEFARLAVIHGTVATVSDPHEIANVCGIEGVRYMIDNGNKVPFKFHFGAPSCVPATSFETAGAAIDADQVRDLLQLNEIFYLSEMMNFPGVLNSDPDVLKKISAAHSCNKPVDGHAPGLRGADAKKYIDAGITTDHECFTKEEALDKLKYGMKIIIREGSAAKNFEALIGLLSQYPEQIMFCSDDKHPDSLVEGHINVLCARAVKKGLDIFKIIQAACVNPALHYGMQSGILRVGDPADFIIVRDLVNFNVLKTFINGEIVSEGGKTLLDSIQVEAINNFNCTEKTVADFKIPVNHGQSVFPVIEALDGQLITNQLLLPLHVENGFYVSNVHSDVLKIAVINRYSNAPVAISFIKNFGLKRGAIASSVAHDSHNIVAVGVDDESICRAVNCVIRQRGGISCIDREKEYVVSLPVGGLMSTEDGFSVAKAYTAIDAKAKELGSELSAPFMTLSFMALLVIPHLKLSDKGLFDVDKFALLESYGKQKAG